MAEEKTIFARIIDDELPSEKIYEDEHCIVIRDINPQAPVHVLVIPRQPLPKLSDATEQDKAMLGHCMWAAGEVARQLGVDDAFRLIVNNGAGAGQTVFHLHLHIIAGATFDEGGLAG